MWIFTKILIAQNVNWINIRTDTRIKDLPDFTDTLHKISLTNHNNNNKYHGMTV